VITKIGDIFSVKVDESHEKYFQLIAFDLTQLNSDVIRAFKKKYPIGAKPDMSEIVKGEVEFYAHCVTKWGIKLGFWEKAGKSSEVGRLDHILFRGTPDNGCTEGEAPTAISNRGTCGTLAMRILPGSESWKARTEMPRSESSWIQ